FEAFLAARDEPDWATERRRAAWELFQAMDWPARGGEEWTRTDIRTFRLDKFSLEQSAPSQELPAPLLTAGVELGGSLASLNGNSISAELSDECRRQGVIYCSMDTAVREHGDLVRRYLGTVVDEQYDRFAALHSACWSGGAFLYVPRGAVVQQPLHALSAMTDGGVDFGHTLVVLEDGAEATLMTECKSTTEEGAGLHCGGVELVLAPGARLRFVNFQQWGHGVWHFAHQKAALDRDADLQWTLGALGSKLAKVNQHVLLAGEGAYSQVNGVMFTEGKQHLSYHTLQHHGAPHTKSDFLYKAALQDQSRTVWRGMIKVDPAAQRTDGYQRNDNLLLSSSARADSIPGLEIEADDVRCTHGSTSGRVDEEQIFYCQSRGFTRKEAARAIVIGFFQQVFDRITIESVRESLGAAVARKVREYE
ncbi:MAG: Fe-S cluster assembly protein SufD, partial [Planctomycetales bacterium]|nr:Fe-S cluster assembly protein SufD [Planctomycetales bacterium]